MKKAILLLTVITFLVVSSSKSQIKKRSWLIGGQLFSDNLHTNYSPDLQLPENKYKQTFINLSVGKAFKENSIYGVSIFYAPISEINYYTQLGFGNLKQYTIGAGLYWRKYKKLGNDFYLFGETGLIFQCTHQTFSDTSGHNLAQAKQPLGQLYFTPGVSYQLLKKLQVELSIPNIISIVYTVTNTESSGQKELLLGTNLNSISLLTLSVGFHFVLGS
ncbi:MAG: hypothetical protein ABUT20_60870 [Bacteroidota bacterium]